MSENQPREDDAVLGGQAPPPVYGAVLGGLAGVKHRPIGLLALARRSALIEALKGMPVGSWRSQPRF